MENSRIMPIFIKLRKIQGQKVNEFFFSLMNDIMKSNLGFSTSITEIQNIHTHKDVALQWIMQQETNKLKSFIVEILQEGRDNSHFDESFWTHVDKSLDRFID